MRKIINTLTKNSELQNVDGMHNLFQLTGLVEVYFLTWRCHSCHSSKDYQFAIMKSQSVKFVKPVMPNLLGYAQLYLILDLIIPVKIG